MEKQIFQNPDFQKRIFENRVCGPPAPPASLKVPLAPGSHGDFKLSRLRRGARVGWGLNTQGRRRACRRDGGHDDSGDEVDDGLGDGEDDGGLWYRC